MNPEAQKEAAKMEFKSWLQKEFPELPPDRVEMDGETVRFVLPVKESEDPKLAAAYDLIESLHHRRVDIREKAEELGLKFESVGYEPKLELSGGDDVNIPDSLVNVGEFEMRKPRT